MDRPDTGSRNNMIMEMAASILDSKVSYCMCVAKQFEEKGDPRAAEWRQRAEKAKLARDVIDENAGCWS